jgi:hypothetical protein
MNIRDHDQACEHAREEDSELGDGHANSKYAEGHFIDRMDTKQGWCPGGAPINLDVAAGYLSAIDYIPASEHPSLMREALEAGLEKGTDEALSAFAELTKEIRGEGKPL